jgi:sugar fermentation stimulation protein A
MRLPPLVRGRFVRRDNRFRATVQVEGRMTWAHVPNSGRLTELFTPDRPIWLAPARAPHRKTGYDLKLVEYAGVLVSVDARLPNPLFAEALARGNLPGWGRPGIAREVTRGDSRLDFRLSGPEGIAWVETKSVTLVEDGLALFPDAPTARGRRHLEALVDAVGNGDAAAVVFVVQRPDAQQFAPHEDADPAFAEALRQARAAGVAVQAYACHVSLQEMAIQRTIPIFLEK